MRILLLGAGGFIGRELLAALAARGHRVVAGVRRRGDVAPMGADTVATIDLNHATDPADWMPLLADCDAVVNCAGILQGTGAQSIDAIHARAPIALFTACEQAGVRRVVQISAISAEEGAGTDYARTKRAADDHLRASSLEWTVIRPSLVVARGAYGGTGFMRALSALPFAIPVPGDGLQEFQPVHVHDVARVVVIALEEERLLRTTVDPVGPDVVTLRRLLEDYRRWLGFAPVPVVAVPRPLVRIATWFGDRFGGPMNSTASKQMEFGNTGDHAAFAKATGFDARRWRDILAQEPSHGQDRWHARLYFVRPLLRAALCALWLGSAIVGLYALPEWGALLANTVGMPVRAALSVLALFCVADGAIAWLLARRWRPRRMALIQVAMVAGYTVVASVLWPALWADPLGALLKNLPIAAAILILGAIEEER